MLLKYINQEELKEVYHLTYKEYLREGYIQPNPEEMISLYPHLDNILETTTIGIYDKQKLIGTISWTLDGPFKLHTDIDFPEETQKVRDEGRRLAASWRIVTDYEYRKNMTVVFNLILAVVEEMLIGNIETALFTFNPKHEKVYRQILNMDTVAKKLDSIKGMNNAPAVLMRLDIEKLSNKWVKEIIERYKFKFQIERV
ncbi:MAG: hypothetical protein KatS3mg002_0305 [Candidatus Woesearchaeota archaeon]|nr:MAG: hypothetical protein KatS3mg002_0305 [Candidatus Woesearchaeota archaeon]